MHHKVNPTKTGLKGLINKAIGRINKGVSPTIVDGKPVFYFTVDKNHLTDDMGFDQQVFMCKLAAEHIQPGIDWIPLIYNESLHDSHLVVKFMKNGDQELPFLFEPDTIAYVIDREGIVYMNDDFDYTNGWKVEGMNGVIVIGHEFGHGISWGHSDLPTSLMAPYIDPSMGAITHDILEESEHFYGEYRQLDEPEAVPETPEPEHTPIDLIAIIKRLLDWIRGLF